MSCVAGKAIIVLGGRDWLEARMEGELYAVELVHIHRAEGARGYAQRRTGGRSRSLLEAVGAALEGTGHDGYAAARRLTERAK